jgi:hypothetical protein
MSFCANCGRQHSGTARFCPTCGAEFSDAQAGAAEGAGSTELAGPAQPADVTRRDAVAGDTHIEGPGPRPGQPDPFASWYQGGPAAAGGWQQPTQTVGPAPPTYPQGYEPQGYQATEYLAPGYQAPGYQAPGYQAPAGPYGQPPYGPGTPPYSPLPPGSPTGQPPRPRGRGLLILLAIVIVLAAGGGAYALATTLGKTTTAQSPPSPTAQASTPPASASGTQPSGGTSPSASRSPSASPTPSPALSLVAVGPGVAGSAVPQVEAVLSHRFQAINAHDYDEYAATLTSGALAKQPQSTFDSGYATTTDSGMTLTALTSAGSELAATVTFTSEQDPADSVDHSRCNTWTMTLYLAPSGSGYLVDNSPASAPAATHGDC